MTERYPVNAALKLLRMNTANIAMKIAQSESVDVATLRTEVDLARAVREQAARSAPTVLLSSALDAHKAVVSALEAAVDAKERGEQ